jgi:hypothetical protein
MSMMLAENIMEVVRQSGAAQTEILAALGIVHCLLPVSDIPSVVEGDRGA